MTTVANETGLYAKYRLTATAGGFKSWERDNIELSVSKAATLPVELEVGSQTENNFSSKKRVYARWSWRDFQIRNSNAIAALGGNHRNGREYGNGGVIESVTTLTPGTILNMRAALQYWRELIGPPDFGSTVAQWGRQASLVAQLPGRNMLPSLTIAATSTRSKAVSTFASPATRNSARTSIADHSVLTSSSRGPTM